MRCVIYFTTLITLEDLHTKNLDMLHYETKYLHRLNMVNSNMVNPIIFLIQYFNFAAKISPLLQLLQC